LYTELLTKHLQSKRSPNLFTTIGLLYIAFLSPLSRVSAVVSKSKCWLTTWGRRCSENVDGYVW